MGKRFNSNNVDRALSHSSRVKLNNNTETSDAVDSKNINAKVGGEYTARNASKSKKALKITQVGSARGVNPL